MIEGLLLLVVECERLGGDDGFGGFGVAADVFGGDFDEPFCGETFERWSGAVAEIGDREGAIRGVDEKKENRVLFRGTFFELREFYRIDVFDCRGDAAGFRGVVLGADGFR